MWGGERRDDDRNPYNQRYWSCLPPYWERCVSFLHKEAHVIPACYKLYLVAHFVGRQGTLVQPDEPAFVFSTSQNACEANMARMQGIRRYSENEEEPISWTPPPHSTAALSHLLLHLQHHYSFQVRSVTSLSCLSASHGSGPYSVGYSGRSSGSQAFHAW